MSSRLAHAMYMQSYGEIEELLHELRSIYRKSGSRKGGNSLYLFVRGCLYSRFVSKIVSKISEPNLRSRFAKFMKEPDQTGPRHHYSKSDTSSNIFEDLGDGARQHDTTNTLSRL
jgi:hypothetical protein